MSNDTLEIKWLGHTAQLLNMKHKLTTILIATLLLAGSAFANDFRVFYYVEGKNISWDTEGNEKKNRPFKYSTVAKTKGAAFDALMKNEPEAIDVTINSLSE